MCGWSSTHSQISQTSAGREMKSVCVCVCSFVCIEEEEEEERNGDNWLVNENVNWANKHEKRKKKDIEHHLEGTTKD